MEYAKHRLEVATDLVCDIKRMEKEAEGIESESNRGKKITPLQVKEMAHAFNLFDRNSDKALDVDELASVFRALGQNPTRVELEKIIKDADRNENGKIEEDEFVDMLVKRMQSKKDIERDLEEAFEAFDRNGDGRLDKTELMRVLCMTGDRLTEEEAEEMIHLMGDKGDKSVDLHAFTRFLCSDLPDDDSAEESQTVKPKQPKHRHQYVKK